MTEEKNKPIVKTKSLQDVLNSFAQTTESRLKEQEEILALKEELIKAEPEPEQTHFSFFPVELMRTSIFFPFRHDELNREHRKISKITIKHSWGELEIEGVKLAIYQEDILLKLLTEKDEAIQTKSKKHDGFKITYKLSNIAKTKKADSRSGANQNQKQRILDALKDFQLINFLIKRKKDISSIGSIVHSWVYHKDTDLLDVYFNPEFWTLFGEGMLACINITKRQQLQGDCAKALSRFIQAHKKPTELHLITIMKALNYNTNQPDSMLARILERGINELIKIGELDKKSNITKNYIVFLEYPETQKQVPKQKKSFRT
ncbi:MAG: hypothetical protein ACD_79C00182G0005 [uncultured bacterium]|nr:MAG: hypothetical protein ACD_79C00182G0005 [uncultured bacterium]